jgi:hypothetical protein
VSTLKKTRSQVFDMIKAHLRALAYTAVLVAGSVTEGFAQAPAPPTGLNAQVNGNFVQVSWNASAGALTYIIQAGSASGASNLANTSVGGATTVGGGPLPNGTYFFRVIAVGLTGERSTPSAESQFTIGGGGCTPPGPPQGFTASVSGLFVTLRWSPGGGGAPTSYIIEAGSGSGLANLAVLPTGNTGTEFSTPAPAGVYFLRIRSQNACGVSGPSNEQSINVGGPPEPGPGPGPGCTYAISPGSVNVPAGGGQFQVNVATQSSCRWQLQASAFISPNSMAGTGPGTAQFSVGATAASRSGQVTIAPVDPGPVTAGTVAVQQNVSGGGTCTITLNPTSQQVTSSGGTFQVRVNAAAGCGWSVTPLGGFISVVSSGQLSGSDTVVYLVSPNTAEASRMAGLRVTSSAGSQELSVIQSGVGPLNASFVLRDNGQETTSCQLSGANGNRCSLDASASTPPDQIVLYTWSVLRNGAPLSVPSVRIPTLNLVCDPTQPPAPANTIEPLDVTLIVTSNVGSTAMRVLSIFLAGCGQ